MVSDEKPCCLRITTYMYILVRLQQLLLFKQIFSLYVKSTVIIVHFYLIKLLWIFIATICLCWGLMSQSTIFQSCRDGATASWVINQYFRWVKCLAQGHNTAAVGFEPRLLAPESDTLPLSHRAPQLQQLHVYTNIKINYKHSLEIFDLVEALVLT